MTRSPRTVTHSRWNKSHPKSAKAHFASAPQNMLPRRCWNELHPRQTASPVGSTARCAVYAQAGHRLRPRAIARSQATTTPPPTIPTKAGKGIRTLDIQLGKLTLYQLSYARELCSVYQWDSCCWLLVAGCCYGCTRLVFTPPKPARLPVLLRSYS